MSVKRGSHIADLIGQLHLTPQTVVIEYNGEPLLRELFAATELEPGDEIEVAHMVGGG